MSICVMADIAGIELTSADEQFLLQPEISGLILFSRNYKNPQQLKTLCRKIKLLRADLIISVDQEGGRVQRFREGFTRLPPMRALGAIWDTHPQRARHLARDAGYVLAAELLTLPSEFVFISEMP